MSHPILPLAVWQSGTNENSIPANDNALRVEVALKEAISIADSEPADPEERDLHIVGTTWGGFTTNNAVIYLGGTWYEYEAFVGWVKSIDGTLSYFDGEDWVAGAGGIPDAPSDGKLYGRKNAAWEEVPGGGGGTDLGWFDVTQYGAAGDGVTDDTEAIQDAIDAAELAGGGVVYFPRGEYIVDGGLQDTSRANAQILLPSIDVLTGDQITIELVGPFAPTPDISVIGDLPVAEGGAVIRSTLTTGSGGNLLGGMGPSGSAGDFTNILLVARNLTFRMPENPTHSAVDLSHVACVELDNVIADTGSYYIEGLAEPTTSTSYGIKMPRIQNGARSTIGVANVIGFHTGWLFGEHVTGGEVNSWGCKYAAESPAGNHACIIQRLQSIHCPNGIRATGGASYLQIDQMNIEHATSGWWTAANDIDDANNYLVGNLRWHVVKANVGVDDSFVKNGGANIACTQLGDNSGGGGGATYPVVVNTALAATNVYAADVGTYTRFTATTAKSITVRPNSTEALPSNGEWHFRNVGAGNLTITPGSGVTVTPPAGGTLLIPPGGTVTLKRVGTDAFDLFGQTVAA